MTKSILYILMRNDMDSLNPGKAMAQASHASARFIIETQYLDAHGIDHDRVERWKKEGGGGFGTTIVLACDEETMLNKIYMAKSMHLICGIILDGTYPLQDGDALHLFPVNTCAYIFIEDEDRKSTRLNSSYIPLTRMPSSA